jgi:hypothetical protein
VTDRYAFFIPFYCLASVLFGIGFYLVVRPLHQKVLVYLVFILALLPLPVYFGAAVVAEKMQFKLPTRANVPYRNDYTWFLRPWKTGYSGAEKFADEVFKKLEPGAVVYADTTMVYPLLYMQQVKGKRADIRIISRYAASSGLPLLNEKSLEAWFSEGDVYSVSPVRGTSGDGIVWKISD